MSAPRLHLPARLAAGAAIPLEDDRVHYLRTVLRLRGGAPVRAFNGTDGEWLGHLADLGRRGLELRLAERVRPSRAEPGPTLAFAPIRRSRLDWLVEKAVELGAERLVPVLTERTVVRPEKATRLAAIAAEAAEQCERLTVPVVDAPVALPDWLTRRDGELPLLFAEERGQGAPLADALRRCPAGDLLIGPEGGFSAREKALLHATPAVVAVSLGERILRAETAALYMLAAWQLVRPPR
jgi:16S rRNA (uracil1498-N3)-methyltransferase